MGCQGSLDKKKKRVLSNVLALTHSPQNQGSDVGFQLQPTPPRLIPPPATPLSGSQFRLETTEKRLEIDSLRRGSLVGG